MNQQRAVAASVHQAIVAPDAGAIQIYTVGIKGLENLMRQAIQEKLGPDRDALKALEVVVFRPTTQEQADALHRLGRNLFEIKGALGLNDSGVGWRVFSVNIEEGMSDKYDREVAEQLAFKCYQCVQQMKRKRNGGVISV